jgi:site-specific DNA-methyltransferase (adenine-specific)/adenine-specific DNA-methyltransferase
LDGKLKGASVLVFNHLKNPDKRIDEETIEDIHSAVGKKIGNRFFIIAPKGVFDFQQDYIDLGGVRYYALRIPYSIINELHHREFTALQQPNDETAVNETVDAVGFDFIQPPKVDRTLSVVKSKNGDDEICLTIKSFESRARLRGKDTQGGLETFSMLMLDYDHNGKIFNMDTVIYAHQMQNNGWQTFFPLSRLGTSIMIVFIDIYGNEAREVISRDAFAPSIPQPQSKKNKKVRS